MIATIVTIVGWVLWCHGRYVLGKETEKEGTHQADSVDVKIK